MKCNITLGYSVSGMYLISESELFHAVISMAKLS